MGLGILQKLGNFPGIVQGGLAVVGVVVGLGATAATMVIFDDNIEKKEFNFPSNVDIKIVPELKAVELLREDELVKKVIVPKTPIKIRPKETFKPKTKVVVKKKKKKTGKKVEKLTDISNMKIVDDKQRRIDVFNASAFQFSKKDHGRLSSKKVERTPQYERRIKRIVRDRNKQDTWNVRKDINTYPTDLSRVVTKEKIIRAITGNRIVSTLKGRVIIYISKNVYGAQGNKVLIPKGSKGSGYYEQVSNIGDGRINIYIERIVHEESGQLIIFRDPAKAGDQQGSAGVTGEVDNQYLKKFGLPLVFSMGNNMANLGMAKAMESIENIGGELPEGEQSLTDQIFDAEYQRSQQQTNQQIMSEMIKQNINVKEKITIPAATEIVLYLNNDIWFKKNRNKGSKNVTAVRLKNDWRNQNK